MSSSRLRGKVLRDLAGKPVLGHLLDSLSQCVPPDVTAVLTSTDPSDDLIVQFCRDRSVSVFRGDLLDVASRFHEAAQEYACDAFVRLTGDSPLLDYRIVDRAIEIWREGHYDLVTNAVPRTFPVGQTVEILAATCLSHHLTDFSAHDREHVTPFFHREALGLGLAVATFGLEPPAPDLHLAVDTPEDLEHLGRIYAELSPPYWQHDVKEVLRIARRLSA